MAEKSLEIIQKIFFVSLQLTVYFINATFCTGVRKSLYPIVKWAQRSDVLFITIELPDAKGIKLHLEPEGKFYFSATSGADNVKYEVDFELYDKVNVNESKTSVTSRSVYYLVKKDESKWWSRLLKKEGKPPIFLKVDWDKWVDEDEQDEHASPGASDPDLSDFDFSNLNMGGGPEEFGDDEDDDDDDNSDTEEDLKEEAGETASTEGKTAARTINDPHILNGSVPETKA